MTDDKEERWQQELDKDREVFFDNGGEDGREKKYWVIPKANCKHEQVGICCYPDQHLLRNKKSQPCSYANCQIKVDKDGIPTEIKKVWNNEHDDVWDKIIADTDKKRKQYDAISACAGRGVVCEECMIYAGCPGALDRPKSENDEKVKKCHKG